MKKTISCLVTVSCALLVGCHKNDAPQPATPAQLLVGKKWQLQSSLITAPSQPPIDLYALTASYTKDDFEQFDLPDVFTYDEGPTKYGTSSQQTQRGTWALSTDNTRLTVKLGTRTTEYLLEEVTSASLKFRITQRQGGGSTSVLTHTFVVIP